MTSCSTGSHKIVKFLISVFVSCFVSHALLEMTKALLSQLKIYRTPARSVYGLALQFRDVIVS